MPANSVHAPSADVHNAEPPHPGPWTERVYVVLSERGVHWIGSHKPPADAMAFLVTGRVVTMETGTAYTEGK